jgi:hypothetical protein
VSFSSGKSSSAQTDNGGDFGLQAGELPLSGEAMADLLRLVEERCTPFRFRARGHSMFPFVRDGDVLTISPIGPESLRCGDVVAVALPVSGRLAVHRIVSLSASSVVTRGDNVRRPDGRVPLRDVLGRVARVERRGSDVGFGGGFERGAVALLTRTGLVPWVLAPAWRRLRPLLKKSR